MEGKVGRKGFEWTYSGRTLLFFIFYEKECTKIDLNVGYGPPEILDQLFMMAKDPPFDMPLIFIKDHLRYILFIDMNCLNHLFSKR